jgi:hypothetical protein
MERIVKFRKSLYLFLLITPCIATAEVGDIHTVKVDNAVVRDGPGEDKAQVDKLGSGSEIMEMDVQGEWYEIYVASTDLSGWMHVSSLELLGGGSADIVAEEAAAVPASTGAGDSAPKPAAKPAAPTKLAIKSSGAKSAGMKTFEKYLVKYNARTNVLKGYVPFTGAEDAGDGELHLTVTNNWLEKSKARQKSSLITLYSKWKRANPSLANVKVVALDPSGNEVVQYPNR